MSAQHFDPQTLAALAEGHQEILTDDEWRHLAECPQCCQAVFDTVQVRADYVQDPDEFASPAEMVSAIRQATDAPEHGMPTIRPARPAWLNWAVPLAAAAVLALVLIPRLQDAPGSPNQELFATIGESARLTNGLGMVLPRVPLASPTARETFRAADGGRTAELVAAVGALGEAYTSDRGDRDLAFWLVTGYLALDELDKAGLFVRDALEFHPQDNDLTALAAIVAYRNSQLVRADSLIRATLERDRDLERVRYNLGLLLLDSDRPEAGNRILNELGQGASETLLSELAQTRLEE